MKWQKVSDTRWERPVDGMEGYFIVTEGISASLSGGREHYTMLSKIKLESDLPDTETALRNAWKQIRYEQPQLATTVEGMKKVYEVPDAKALEEWLASTFIVSPASNADELFPTFTGLKKATLYYVPKSSEVVFRGHHHTIDGMGMLLFWHSFLEALKSPNPDVQFGNEAERLAPAFEDALGFSEQPTKELQDEATALFMTWAGSIPGIGPASQVGAALPGKCRNIDLVFDEETSEKLITACKSKSVTVTSAVHAAYIGAISKYADPKGKLSEYVSANQFNLRQYLPAPYNSNKYAVSVYYSPLPYKICLPASFWDVAKSLHEYYQTSFKNKPEMLELKGHFARVLCGAVQTPEFLASPVPRDALVSSLGVADEYVQHEYGGIRVKDLSVAIDVVAGMSMFFIYTTHGRLKLAYSFNDAYEKPDDIQKYLDEVKAILYKELLG
ncbi:hypothetical protein F5Y17DRAFT_342320 [Xylariaceae sp. FL0594]|nr:hypothetical protein F5Y17DRAFT_342320 [Xylariaceae sp. FL0594]